MSLLLAVFEPTTTAASMAIDRPRTIDDAPARGPQRSGGCRGETFLFREEWAFSPGEESRSADVAAQSIEAQPVFGQIRPSRSQVRPSAEQHPQETTWRISVVPHKMQTGSGAEKEIMAQEKAGWFIAEKPLSNPPDSEHRWAIDRDRIDEARLRSGLLPCDVNT
jgi:hypothetical protein